MKLDLRLRWFALARSAAVSDADLIVTTLDAVLAEDPAQAAG